MEVRVLFPAPRSRSVPGAPSSAMRGISDRAPKDAPTSLTPETISRRSLATPASLPRRSSDGRRRQRFVSTSNNELRSRSESLRASDSIITGMSSRIG